MPEEVEVLVYRDGRKITKIVRPLRTLPDGTEAVTFRKQLHRVVNGAIYLDATPERDSSSTPQPAREDSDAMPQDSDDANALPEGWHSLQRNVIEAKPHERLLVDAGPGTGKTQVACARVAHLITIDNLSPSAVWFISFTRTAVTEMRNRIAANLGEVTDAQAVRIATLDAHAWSLHSGFDERATLTGSHDTNIERAIELIRSDELLEDHLGSVEHVVVDEAQDIVGVRAELIMALAARLPSQCGMTVFADEAQAIYGFAGDAEWAPASHYPEALMQRLRAGGFEMRSLKRVYRTTSKGLLHLFTESRARLLSDSIGKTCLADIRRDIAEYADGKVDEVENQALQGAADTLVLFRKRAEVLLASTFLMNRQIRVRVRMSGVPSCLQSWLGVCLSDHTETYLSRPDFEKRWATRIKASLHEQISEETAWALLLETAGKTHTTVEMRRLRSILGRVRPPPGFCTPELGTEGPILGTIHASKGREAKTVHLMLPGMLKDESKFNLGEEARVLFVGATRARENLKVGRGYQGHFPRNLKSGRAYNISESGNVQVEVGHDDDVTAASMVGTAFRVTSADAQEIQDRLQRLALFPIRAEAEASPKSSFIYQLRSKDLKHPLGAFSNQLNSDLFEIGRNFSDGRPRRPPRFLNNLFIIGVRTVILPAEHVALGELHEPWRVSGILLAPVVLAYTSMPLSLTYGAQQ